MNGRFHPERIVLARTLSGMTQKQTAEESGLSQAKISKLEKSVLPFAENDALAIAFATGMPLSFFEHTGSAIPMSELTYRRTSKTTMRELEAVSAECRLLSETIDGLAATLGIANPRVKLPYETYYQGATLPLEEIEAMADATRAALGVAPSGPVRNVTRSIERTGIPVVRLSSMDHSGSGRSEGVCRPGDKEHRWFVGYRGDVSGDRSRFTKAHELGHLVLHSRRLPGTQAAMEKEAQEFAGAFLFPSLDAGMLNRSMPLRTYMNLKSGWGISISALIERAWTRKAIDTDRRKSLKIQMSMRGWSKQEPVAVGPEKPILYRQLLQAAYPDAHGGVDWLKAEDSTGAPVYSLSIWAGTASAQVAEPA